MNSVVRVPFGRIGCRSAAARVPEDNPRLQQLGAAMAITFVTFEQLAHDIVLLEEALSSRTADWNEKLAAVQTEFRKIGRRDLATDSTIHKGSSWRSGQPPTEEWVLCDKTGYPL